MQDPFSVLGVDPDVSERELVAAYRRLAKRWHPDRGTPSERMAALNAAYAEARAVVRRQAPEREIPVRRRPPAGRWLAPPLRRQVGAELLAALAEGERVALVADAGAPGRGPVRLALTDRRLLWLHEDAVAARIDWIRFGIVSKVERRRGRLRRDVVGLAIRTRTGRRVAFTDLEPDVADAIAARIKRAAGG